MLGSAWLLGELFHRVGQPALIGQLLAGVLIGPSLLNVVQPSTALSTVESVALFFIMLLTGLTVNPSKIVAAGKRGAVVSSVAFVIPFASGFLAGRSFGIGTVASLTVGLTISITAVPVNSVILMELGLLDTELGAAVISAGVIDDIVSFVALSMIQRFASEGLVGGYSTVVLDVVKVVVFLGALILCEHLIRANLTRVRRWVERLVAELGTPGSYFAVLLILSVGISLLAEWAGLQLVIGAFFAGILLGELGVGERLERSAEVVRSATWGFFGPIAFTFIGTELVISSIGGTLLLVCTLLVLAIASKLAGGYLGARLVRFSRSESVTIGFLMNSRGFVELVVAATAYRLGLIDQTVFSIVVAVGIITTIISPIASRVTLRRTKLHSSTLEPSD